MVKLAKLEIPANATMPTNKKMLLVLLAITAILHIYTSIRFSYQVSQSHGKMPVEKQIPKPVHCLKRKELVSGHLQLYHISL